MRLSTGNHGRSFELKLIDIPGMLALGFAMGIVGFLSLFKVRAEKA